MKKLLLASVFIASTAHGGIFTWTDSRGVAHYTNSEYDIPARYRAKAKIMYQGQTTSSPQQSGQNQAGKPEAQPPVQGLGGTLTQPQAPVSQPTVSQPQPRSPDQRPPVRKKRERRERDRSDE